MEAPQWVKNNPVYTAIFVILFICASLIQPLWSLFTSQPLVPTVAGWLGYVVNDWSLMWLPFVGVPVGLLMLYGILREVKTQSQAPAGPVTIDGIAEQSQIFRGRQRDLQLNIGVKFKNAESRRIVGGFKAFMISGDSKRPIRVQSVNSTAPHTGETRVSMDNLPIEQGTSVLHYICCHVDELDEPKGETFQIEVDVLGQTPERLEVIPHWYHINQGHLANTVREIRRL